MWLNLQMSLFPTQVPNLVSSVRCWNVALAVTGKYILVLSTQTIISPIVYNHFVQTHFLSIVDVKFIILPDDD